MRATIHLLACLLIVVAGTGCITDGSGGGKGGGTTQLGDPAGVKRVQIFFPAPNGTVVQAEGDVQVDAAGNQVLGSDGKPVKTGRWVFFYDPVAGKAARKAEQVFLNGVHDPNRDDYILFNNDDVAHVQGSIQETRDDRLGR